MNENLIAENLSFKALHINNKAVAIVPKDVSSKLDVVMDVEKGRRTKEIIDSEQKDMVFGQENGVIDFVSSDNKKTIYIIPLIGNEYLNKDADETTRTNNYNVLFGAIGSVINEHDLDAYVDRQQTIRILILNDNDKAFCDWLEANKEKPGSNFIEGITLDDLKKKFESEKENVGPVSEVNPFIGAAPVEAVPVALVEPVAPIAPEPVIPAAEPVPVTPEPIASVPSEPVVEPTPVAPVEPVAPVVEANPIVPEVAPAVAENPAPVVSETAPVAEVPNTVEAAVSVAAAPSAPVTEPVVEESKSNSGVVSNVARAGFVKFPVFLLTILAIGAFGIFIGRMVYTYISQM